MTDTQTTEGRVMLDYFVRMITEARVEKDRAARNYDALVLNALVHIATSLEAIADATNQGKVLGG